MEREITLFGNTFSNKRKEDFYTELSVLLKAGVTLKEALSLIEDSQRKKSLKTFFKEMIDEIISGKSFSDVMQSRKEFTDYEFHSIRIGEETGTMSLVSGELGQFFARKNEQRRNLIGALMYPIIIFVTAVGVVAFMLSFVVPMFQDIFKQNNVELPGITKLIIRLSEGLKAYGWLLLIVIVLGMILRSTLSKKHWYRKRKDRFMAKLPFFGKFIKTVYLAQFTQAVALLSASKVPVVNSIQLVKKMISFYPLQEALEKVEKKVIKGHSLSESLRDNSIFDHKMIALVKVAEETNQTEYIFERLNQQYNQEVQQRSKMLSTVIEPMIIVFVGIMVGVILIAMYLPMFRLSSVLG
ncbi:type II secretion system F family protein [Ascidiimonas aurantiaca]|uniref:type II secretion system F family protein n=1 Tax=Ascidiimonas aurantiaca TaxID=1685432 RepID=UPI0030EB24B9